MAKFGDFLLYHTAQKQHKFLLWKEVKALLEWILSMVKSSKVKILQNGIHSVNNKATTKHFKKQQKGFHSTLNSTHSQNCVAEDSFLVVQLMAAVGPVRL